MKKENAIKVINAFSASDNIIKFKEIMIENKLLFDIDFIYNRLENMFDELGCINFLKIANTDRQSEFLIHNGELWTHRNMFNVLCALKEQKELDKKFYWLLDLKKLN